MCVTSQAECLSYGGVVVLLQGTHGNFPSSGPACYVNVLQNNNNINHMNKNTKVKYISLDSYLDKSIDIVTRQ